MSKILAATLQSGEVKIGTTPIEAVVLSKGLADSSGIVILDGSLAYYIANLSTDFEELIDSIEDILTKIGEILTGVDEATNSPGAQAAKIAELATLKTNFVALKDSLI